jgi:hypothetical protein
VLKRLRIASIVGLVAGPTALVQAQVLPVPCEAFQQDALGNWIATEQLSMETPAGILDIMPGHPVSARVAGILNARCR